MPIALGPDDDAAWLRALPTRAMMRVRPGGCWRRSATGRRAGTAATGGVTLQIVRDWMFKLNERGPDGLVGGFWSSFIAGGSVLRILTKAVENGPIPAVHGVVRRQVIELCQ